MLNYTPAANDIGQNGRSTLTTPKLPSSASDVPKSSKRIEVTLEDVEFSLKTDEKTLQELDEIHEDSIKAAQATRKFAWR